jgi:hypothetical protein
MNKTDKSKTRKKNLINEDVNLPRFVDFHKHPNQLMMK